MGSVDGQRHGLFLEVKDTKEDKNRPSREFPPFIWISSSSKGYFDLYYLFTYVTLKFIFPYYFLHYSLYFEFTLDSIHCSLAQSTPYAGEE